MWFLVPPSLRCMSPSIRLMPSPKEVVKCSKETKNMLLGLHACGDLSPTIIRLFADEASHFSSLVLVTCCYGLLSEEGCFHSFNNLKEDNKENYDNTLDVPLAKKQKKSETLYGYPMSSQVHLPLGHCCRNLINQVWAFRRVVIACHRMSTTWRTEIMSICAIGSTCIAHWFKSSLRKSSHNCLFLFYCSNSSLERIHSKLLLERYPSPKPIISLIMSHLCCQNSKSTAKLIRVWSLSCSVDE